jgi:hypothetical protein
MDAHGMRISRIEARSVLAPLLMMGRRFFFSATPIPGA